MDKVSAPVRSANMAKIRSKDTVPEKLVRSALHRAGLRFKLHDANLPGKPDIVLPSKQACIFVHGCFWHGCPNCSTGSRRVGSNRYYWEPKLARNKARDIDTINWLRLGGWRVFVIWECEVRGRRVQDIIRALRRLPVENS
ncbi:MAG: DNA mismatch endonuclease Vsr [Betaproteobacteria bacterium]|nr:MAG: DNA mismatch endonuclease Vsr [Betaproteobacteria bacterium]